MKIKERLQNDNTKNEIIEKQVKKCKLKISFSDIFTDSQETKNYFVEQAQNNRNIITVSNKSFDKIIISEYLSSLLKNTKTVITDDIENNIDKLNGIINIIPNPSIKTIVKIFEQILYGNSSFIFGFNLGTYDNIINKLKAVIALNCVNLSQENITTLIGASNPLVVYFSKNNNGLLYISQIDEIQYVENELVINNIFTFNEVKEEIPKETLEKNILPPIQNNETKEKEKPVFNILDIKEEEVKEDNNKQQSEIIEKHEIKADKTEETKIEKEQKPNKYQILKEKSRQKKLAMQTNINQKV